MGTFFENVKIDEKIWTGKFLRLSLDMVLPSSGLAEGCETRPGCFQVGVMEFRAGRYLRVLVLKHGMDCWKERAAHSSDVGVEASCVL